MSKSSESRSSDGWVLFWILVCVALFAMGGSWIIAIVAFGYGWHAARKIQRSRRRAVLLL